MTLHPQLIVTCIWILLCSPYWFPLYILYWVITKIVRSRMSRVTLNICQVVCEIISVGFTKIIGKVILLSWRSLGEGKLFLKRSYQLSLVCIEHTWDPVLYRRLTSSSMCRGFHTLNTWSSPRVAPFPCLVPSTEKIFPFLAIQCILTMEKWNRSVFLSWSEAPSHSRSTCCRQSLPKTKLLAHGLCTVS